MQEQVGIYIIEPQFRYIYNVIAKKKLVLLRVKKRIYIFSSLSPNKKPRAQCVYIWDMRVRTIKIRILFMLLLKCECFCIKILKEWKQYVWIFLRLRYAQWKESKNNFQHVKHIMGSICLFCATARVYAAVIAKYYRDSPEFEVLMNNNICYRSAKYS